MKKQFKLMIFVNAVLGLLFAYSDYYIWNLLNNTRALSFVNTDWSATYTSRYWNGLSNSNN
jgi:hypothetical protein